MNKKNLIFPVIAALFLTGCGNTVSGADQIKAQRYYQYLPLCQKISGADGLTEEQLNTLETEFYTRTDNYEQTMYYIIGENSYMNEIYCQFQNHTLVPVQNYSPMAFVLYQHQNEIAMNPILLMRNVLEGDDDPATEYDNYTDHIFCTEKNKFTPVQEEWTSPTEIYSGTAENFIQKLFSAYIDSETLPVGHTSDSKGNPDMYYVYLIDAREDIEFYAFYFYVDENGIFYQASMDYLQYGGNELLFCLGDSAPKTDACFAGESHAEEKNTLLKNILDISPSKDKIGTYNEYFLCTSGFTREYISDTAGKIAELRHITYQLQKSQDS